MRIIGCFMYVVSSILLAGTALAQDYDYRSAYAAYEVEKRESDAAASLYQHAQSKVTAIQSSLQSARSRLKSLESEYANASQQLGRVSSRLKTVGHSLQEIASTIREYRFTISRLERDLLDEESKLRGVEREIERIDLQRQRLRVRIAQLEQDSPDSPNLPNLRNQLKNLNKQKKNLDSDRSQLRSSVQNIEQDLRRYRGYLSEKEYEQSNLLAEQRHLEREENNLYTQLQNLDSNMTYLQQEIQSLTTDLRLAEIDAASAYEIYQKESYEADVAYNYYLKVKQNYDQAKAQVIARAGAEASKDGQQEAIERATGLGDQKGKTEGAATGTSLGTADGKVRSYEIGYQSGFKQPDQNDATKTAYVEGYGKGLQHAASKAKLEDYPRGYNDAYYAHLATSLAEIKEIDMLESAPSIPPGSGLDLNKTLKNPGNKPAPVVKEPRALPVPDYPTTPKPSFTTPSPDRRHYEIDCSQVILPEFTSVCKNAYDAKYNQVFTQQYSKIIISEFNAAFPVAARKSYQKAFETLYEEQQIAGLTAGANAIGLKKGYQENIIEQRQLAYKSGERDLRRALETGHILVPQLSEISDLNSDGVIAPQELMSVSLAIDNYGGQNSSDNYLRFKVNLEDSVGVTALSSEERVLPALWGNARNKLHGVVTFKSNLQKAGDKFTLSGSLEERINGNWVKVLPVQLTQAVHFPLEVVDLQVPDIVEVSKEAAGTIILQNLTNVTTPPLTLQLSGVNGYAKVLSVDGEVPALEPQGVHTVTFTFEPSIWIGGNVPVQFRAKLLTGGSDNQTVFSPEQIVDVKMSVKRNGSIHVSGISGQPFPNSTLRLAAGSKARIRAQFVFHSNKHEPGPFILERGQKSSDLITSSSGSSIRVNYGSWSPNHSTGPATFSFDIPRSLRGKKEWISLILRDGSKIIHAQQIFLDIY